MGSANLRLLEDLFWWREGVAVSLVWILEWVEDTDMQKGIVGNSLEIMCNIFIYHMRKIIKCLQ